MIGRLTADCLAHGCTAYADPERIETRIRHATLCRHYEPPQEPATPAPPVAETRADLQPRRVDLAELTRIGRALLVAIGEDPERPGVQNTPLRFAKMWRDFVEYDAGATDTVFQAEGTDQVVVVGGIRVWSMCEHHTLPFWCDLAIGYVATDRILGLSKFARLAQRRAHRLQVQERLVREIADDVVGVTQSTHVAVTAVGEHLCMVMRGARSPHRMVSSALYGAFKSDASVRAEFYSLARLAGMEGR